MTIPPIQLEIVGDTTKLGVMGDGAAAWLQAHGIPAPNHVLETSDFGSSGCVARFSQNEFVIEVHRAAAVALEQAMLDLPQEVYRVPRSETTLTLEGTHARSLLRQTCAFDFDEAKQHTLIMTRVAGVSCCILVGSGANYRIWVDCSYSSYLWSALGDIAAEFGGEAPGVPLVRI